MNPHVAMDAHIARRAAATEAKPWLTRGITIEAPVAVALWDEPHLGVISALTVPLAEMAEAGL
jgi:hypothetical protein